MDRMTTDNEKHGIFFLNTFYGKDGKVWVRGAGPAPGYEDCTLVDFLSRAATPLGLSLDEEDPETVGEIMYDNLQFGPMECDGVLGFLWLAAVQATEMRGRLKMIENILGDNYDLDRLREIVDADRDGRCVVLPCELGRTVFTMFGDEVVAKKVSQFRVNSYTNPMIWADLDCKWMTTQSVRWDLAIGKNVFFTARDLEIAKSGGKDEV